MDNMVRLTDERLSHAVQFHPELRNQMKKVRETVGRPDRIVESRSDIAVSLYNRFYKKTPVGAKFLCVVVKTVELDKFILTFYFTDTIKRGKVLWIMGRR